MLNALMCTFDFFQQFCHYIQLLMHIVKFVKIHTTYNVFPIISNILATTPLFNSFASQPSPNVS
jgi:hypothetical protein